MTALCEGRILLAMTRLGSLIRRALPHRAWPYPRGEREIRQVIIVTLLVIFVALAAMIAGLKYQDEKTLGSRDVYFAAKDVSSYSSEAYLLATNTQGQSLVGPYREVYVQQLASDVSEVKDKLATHESAGEMQPRVANLIEICDRLKEALDTFSRQSDDREFAAHAAQLHALAEQAKTIEASL